MILLPVVGPFADIDIYASIIAYANLFHRRGIDARTFVPMTPNYSTPDSLRIKELEQRTLDLQPSDQVIILDISNPDMISELIPNNQIIELIDHRPGHEAYWRERLGDKAAIEQIGAVATIIYERYAPDRPTPAIAKLLLAAILDNTLNLGATITTDRDRRAAVEVAEIAKTTVQDFAAWYFTTVADSLLSDPATSLLGDTKIMHIPKLDIDFAFGQLAVWSADQILPHRAEIERAMSTKHENWLVSIIDISRNQNYLLFSSATLATYFTNLLALEPNGPYLATPRLYLRKEILALTLADI